MNKTVNVYYLSQYSLRASVSRWKLNWSLSPTTIENSLNQLPRKINTYKTQECLASVSVCRETLHAWPPCNNRLGEVMSRSAVYSADSYVWRWRKVLRLGVPWRARQWVGFPRRHVDRVAPSPDMRTHGTMELDLCYHYLLYTRKLLLKSKLIANTDNTV